MATQLASAATVSHVGESSTSSSRDYDLKSQGNLGSVLVKYYGARFFVSLYIYFQDKLLFFR